MNRPLCFLAAACLGLVSLTSPVRAADTKIVLMAGTPSHAPREHEFNAGVLLLEKCLDKIPGIDATAHLNGWPKDPKAFDGAAAVLLFMDGGSGHPLIRDNHLEVMADLMAKGVGLACVHYAVEIPATKGGPELLEWIGGYYETGYSINPHWDAKLKLAADHPITNGVEPFTIRDEWYYDMRFPESPGNRVDILRATPPDETRTTDDTKAHPGREEILSWAIERPDGGRGFGFTGAHFHDNWANEDFRRLVLNALLWVAKVEVPKGGVESTVAPEELELNLDKKGKK